MKENFIEVMRDLETQGYPGISQVYLTILHYELQDQLCATHHIAKHCCVQPSLLKKYLSYLEDNKFVIKVQGDSYNTFKTAVIRATTPQRERNRTLLREIVKSVPMNYDEAVRMERLVKEIAGKSKQPGALASELERVSHSLQRFGSFIGIKSATDLNNLLAIINSQFDSWGDLSASQLKNLLTERQNAEVALQSRVKDQLDQTVQLANRIARSFAQILRRNPEWVMAGGKVRRSDFQDFCNGHFYDFPADVCPLFLIESELSKFEKPILIGD